MDPNALTQRSTASWQELSLETSSATPTARPGASSLSTAEVGSTRSATTTLAPASMNRLAMPKPIPIAAPVMRAFFPARLKGPQSVTTRSLVGTGVLAAIAYLLGKFLLGPECHVGGTCRQGPPVPPVRG